MRAPQFFDKFNGTLMLESDDVVATAASGGLPSAATATASTPTHDTPSPTTCPTPPLSVTAYSLDADQTLLRGCTLMNCVWVVGVVVYTGDETKVRVKQQEVHVKSASVERVVNSIVLWIVVVLVALCLSGATLSSAFVRRAQDGDSVWYLRFTALPTAAQFVQTMFTYFLLNASFIPVSLYVTMRLTRSFQKVFMEADRCV